MAGRKLVATVLAAGTLAVGAVIGHAGTASAADNPAANTAIVTTPAKQPGLTAAEMKSAVKARALTTTATRAGVTPQVACAHLYVCGKAANGNSFAYTRCNVVYQLPNLVGHGDLNNNQTRGTVANFYGRNGEWLFSSTAPDQRGGINWSPVWFARACTS